MSEHPPEEPVDTDAAWRDIVDNYGDRAVVAPEEYVEPDEPRVVRGPDEPVAPAEREAPDWDDEDEDGFVPPAPPPVPATTPVRYAAWVGVLGVPAVVLVLMIAGISLPSILDWLLVAGFIGGFGYLVATMPREPRDPWDDGSRV
ncbi:hypothetical protein [Nocardioides montaniterrae]